MLGSPQRGEVIEPEFGHSIKGWGPHSLRMPNRMALDEPAEPGDAPPDGSVYVVPVARELIDRHARPAGNAVDELDHDRSFKLTSWDVGSDPCVFHRGSHSSTMSPSPCWPPASRWVRMCSLRFAAARAACLAPRR